MHYCNSTIMVRAYICCTRYFIKSFNLMDNLLIALPAQFVQLQNIFFTFHYNIFRLLSVTTHKNWLLSLLRNPLLSFSHIFILLSDQAIIIARNTPTHSYSLFPAPIPTFSITNCSGSCSLVRSAAAIAAPVGVTNSPSTFVICNFK